MAQQPRAVNWVFTINNPEDYELPLSWPDVKYAVWQAEVGESGTEHLQGYVVFKERKRLSQLKATCNAEAHWETRKGTHEQAKAYCMKGGPDDSDLESRGTRIMGPFTMGSEEGIPKVKGQRTDLIAVKAALDDNSKEFGEVISEHFEAYMKYPRAMMAYRGLKIGSRKNQQPKIVIYWGPTGTGKSRRAHETYPGAYRKMKSEWWQNYKGEEVVIFDDFYGWLKYDEMLRILDWYVYEINFKGGSSPLAAHTFVFTSNKPWEEWYSKITDLSALQRRIDQFGEVNHMVDQWEPINSDLSQLSIN